MHFSSFSHRFQAVRGDAGHSDVLDAALLLPAQVRLGRHRHELRDSLGGLWGGEAPLPREEARLLALGHFNPLLFHVFI